MKQQSKLNSQESQQQTAGQQTEKQAVREFGTVEEMLRHDALHTPVPPRIALRLQESINQMPRPASSWWRRFFGNSNP